MDYHALSDVELTNKIQKKEDNLALETLISRHGALANNILTKFIPALTQSGVCLQDVYNEKDMTFYKAAKTYKKDKGAKVSTHIANYFRYLCLGAIHSQGKNVEISVEDISNVINKESSYDFKDNYFFDEIFHILKDCDNKNISEVFRLRYCDGPKKASFKEIGDKLGVSVQTIKNWHDSSIEYLRGHLEMD